MFRTFLSLFCLLLALPLAAARHALTLGVSEGAAPGLMKSEMSAVLAHVNTSPNIAVTLKVYPTHDALYAGLKKNEVDLAFLGAVYYVQAHFETGAIPLVSEGESTRSAIVVAPKSPIRTVKDLRGKRFAFGYRDSTTTYLIPLLLLSKNGIKDGDVQGTFAGHRPQKIVDAMLRGEYDACALSEYVLSQNRSRVRVLEQSEAFPGPPIVARKDLDVAAQNEVRRMFASYKAPADALKQHFASGAATVSDADYNRIRFLAKVMFKKMYQ